MRIILATLFLITWQSADSQQFNRPINSDLFPYQFISNDNLDHGFILAGMAKIPPPGTQQSHSPYPVIYDNKGYVAWYSKPAAQNLLGFEYNSQFQKYTYFQFNLGIVSYITLDQNLNFVDSFTTVNAIPDAHEMQIAQNGNRLILSRHVDTVDLSASFFNGIQGSSETILRGLGIQEITPAGNLVFQWNSNDYINPLDAYEFYGYDPNDYDYSHANAIAEDDDGHLLMSHRHLNAIYKIHRTTGAVIWVLGGVSSDFTFTNDYGFSGQHDIRKLPNGHYSLFDNGNMTGSAPKTRGVEYVLDTINWTATKVHEAIHPNEFFSTAMGSYRKTNDGNSLLGFGFVYRPKASATLLDVNNAILQEYKFLDSVISYRFTHAYDLDLPRSELICQTVVGGIELSAPAGQSSYKWSTGETTQSIFVSNSDTLQVWTPYGSGYIGSMPYIAVNPAIGCNLSINTISLDSPGTNFEYYDLLGRKVNLIEPNICYLKVWDNGKVERILQMTK